MWELLAQQSEPTSINSWLYGITAVTSLGVASWYLIYDVTVRKPREEAARAKEAEELKKREEQREKENRDHNQAMMKGFNDAIREIRQECRQEKDALLSDLKHEREQFSKEREGREDMEKEFVRVLEERKNGDAVLTQALNKLSERIDQVARLKTTRHSGE